MNNLEIAQAAKLRPIDQIGAWAGLTADQYEPLGTYKAKLTTAAAKDLAARPATGKLVVMTAINPTPAGEGKTTMSVGLAEGLNRIGYRAMPALREPALGPVFGVKGGACGGGYSQVVPMEDINLFFTGDMPAITAAHNLLSSMLDAHLHHGDALHIDLQNVWWPRAVDMIDRALRSIVVGLGDQNGPARSDEFVITPASEVMAALCLASSLVDLKERLGDIVLGIRRDGTPVTARDLNAHGSMAALMRDAIRPNLVQTIEGGGALVHGGPFGNIAHGCSSLIGTACGLRMAEYVVTEGGFGSDLGGEKFLNIVAPRLGTAPSVIVLVATIRALKHHGNGELLDGCSNLGQHIKHLKQYGVPVVVAINQFDDDTRDDLDTVCGFARVHGVEAVVANPWRCGGSGCEALAEIVHALSHECSEFRPLYSHEDTFEEKLQALVTKVYGGSSFHLSKAAQKRLKWAKDHGYGQLSVCVAKTQYSLSDEPKLLGGPSGFDISVRDIRVSAGAGFLVAVCGEVMLMPGMGKSPAALKIDVDEDGRISGMY